MTEGHGVKTRYRQLFSMLDLLLVVSKLAGPIVTVGRQLPARVGRGAAIYAQKSERLATSLVGNAFPFLMFSGIMRFGKGMRMRWPVFATFLLAFGLAMRSQAASEGAPKEIAAAVLPLPEQLRNGSAVVRLSPIGVPELIRGGTNNMVCIADRPGDDTFDVRCYHQDFIAVVYRGFQLRAQGVGGREVGDRIEAEIKAGKIHLPAQPTAGYRCLGPASGYNASSNSLSSEIRCWQSIHFPFRTAHEMGLMDESEIPIAMRATMPYVMSSGRYWAHVMIEHPSSDADSEHQH